VKCFVEVALAGAHDGIRIVNGSQRWPIPRFRKWDNQHFSAGAAEPVQMAFELAMEDHITGFDAMLSGVAGFIVSSRKHDGRKGLAVTMSGKNFARIVPHSARRRAAELTM
jgi:hypothetical protein